MKIEKIRILQEAKYLDKGVHKRKMRDKRE